MFFLLVLAPTATATAQEGAATIAADTASALPVEASASAAPVASQPAVTLGWEALVDVYYLHSFTGAPSTQGPGLRAFDTTANNLALNYAKLGLHAETDVVALRLDVGAGHTAAIINRLSRDGSAPDAASDSDALYGDGLLVQQAFATVKPVSFLWIDAGKLMTMAGAEMLEANKNWLYSRSLAFYGLPAWHTGIRVHAMVTPRLAISADLVNGWNSDPDVNAGKTLGANVTYDDPTRGLTVAATSYLGKEGGSDGDDTRWLLDGVVTQHLGRLSLGASGDYCRRGDAAWYGVAAMGRIILHDRFNLALRAEYLATRNGGFLSIDTRLYEVTVQGALTVGGHYELRAELRADMSDREVFAKGTTLGKHQVTGLLAALAYF